MLDLEKDFVVDQDVQAVLEFMQTNISVCKLIGVAECLPRIAKLLWRHYPQNPLVPVSLFARPLSTSYEKQLISTV